MAEDDTEPVDAEEEQSEDVDFDEIDEMSLEEIQADAEETDFGFESRIDTYDPVRVPLNELSANNWNPNEMDSDEFNRLCENIEDDGFLSALQAVPVDEDGNNLDFDEEVTAEEIKDEMHHARIVGGEHRWSAAKVVGMTEVPVVLVPGKSEKWEKMATVRMNSISGDLDPLQFADLVEEQRKDMEDADLKHALGYSGEDTLFDSVLEDIKENAPEEVKEQLEEEEDEIDTIDDLSEVLNRIFREAGDDLDYHFITFSYGGEDNVMYQVNDSLWAEVVDVNEGVKAVNASATEFWEEVFDRIDVDSVLGDVKDTAEIGESE